MPTIAEVRAKYPQYNDMSDSDLAGALHSKFYSDMPRAEFDQKIGLQASKPQFDKYQQAAIDEAKANPAIDSEAGYTRRLVHGATLGADTTLAAAAFTPMEMIKHGTFDPREGYNYAKAREDRVLDESRKNTGILGTATEALGGAVSAGGLAQAGITAGRFLPEGASFLARSAAGGADAAALGSFSGAMEGNGLQERASNAGLGAGVGGVLGAATPAALSLVKLLATPITSNISARLNAGAYARAQVARALSEGKITPQEVDTAVQLAQKEGQGMFTIADAMGIPGQRMLSSVARSPGEGRTAVVDALDARQAGQGRRVANALAEGFDTPETAAQTESRLTQARNTAADSEYGAVRADAKPVDMSGPLSHLDEILGPHQAPRPSSVPPSANPVQAASSAETAGTPAKSQSLLEFLASKGGLGPDAELAAIGGDAHTVHVEGLGRRKLVRQGGLPLDYAREAAEEAGYLRGGHNGTSTVNNLLDAIDAEMRGQKRYPEGFEGYVSKREKATISEREQHERDAFMRGIEDDLSASGHDRLGPDVKQRAVRLMAEERMDADTAVEHALRQLEQEDNVVHSAGFPGDRAAATERAVLAQPNDSIEAILGSYRRRLARVNPNDFAAVQRIRGEMADAAQNAKQNGYGNRARLIGAAVRQLDTAMEDASAGHLAANRNFRKASQDIEAIQQGQNASMRGRTEDTIPAFRSLGSEGQKAFRSGYADPLIADAQKGAFGQNKARSLTSDAFRDESAAMAPNNDLMQRRIARENTMFQTRNAAVGGSKTADNLHDDAALGVASEVLGVVRNVMSGNFGGAVKTALAAGQNAFTGNTPAVRKEIANILLQNGRSMPEKKLQAMVDAIVNRSLRAQQIADGIRKGAVGGAVVTGPGQDRGNRLYVGR
jgi:hypothetical protein